ncbi:MAG: hypothetical protein ACOWWR_09980, partial [Eubacteriales bacterium]
PDDILSRKVNPKSCYVVSTSGHSGSPVKIYRNKGELYYAPIAFIMAYPILPWVMKLASGIKTGRRYSAILPFDENYDLYRIVKNICKYPSFLHRNLQFISIDLDVDEQYRALISHKPDVLSANLSTLKNLVSYAESKELKLPKVKLLFIGGELIDTNSRIIISKAFDAKISEHYGSEEAETIATECPKGNGLHLNWRSCYLELLKNGEDVPDDTPGEVVVTNLRNFTTPIIRYNGMGDVATFSSSGCSCRTNPPLLKMIDGRIVDSFSLPDGRIIHPSRITIPLEDIPGNWRYQIRQEEEYLVNVLVMPMNPQDKDNVNYENLSQSIISRLADVFGNSIRIKVSPVDDIPQPPGSRHKYQTVISLINR